MKEVYNALNADCENMEGLSQKDDEHEKRLEIVDFFGRGDIKTLLVSRGFVSTINTMTLNVLISFELPNYNDHYETTALSGRGTRCEH